MFANGNEIGTNLVSLITSGLAVLQRLDTSRCLWISFRYNTLDELS